MINFVIIYFFPTKVNIGRGGHCWKISHKLGIFKNADIGHLENIEMQSFEKMFYQKISFPWQYILKNERIDLQIQAITELKNVVAKLKFDTISNSYT